MDYVLGVDLGTTFTAAAVCEPGGVPAMLALGADGYAVPSVLFLREDGTFLAGEAAELRSSADPVRVARYFKRRLGDDIPIQLSGTPFAPQVLATRLLEWVVGRATERVGSRPSTVVLTYPANWGPYRREILQQAATMAGVSRTLLISEPEAAAIHYVQSERIEPGRMLGVYDLGGGTFDAVVMRRTATGFEVVGQPSGVERLGGVDFDDAIRSFVLDAADLTDIEQTDEAVTAAYALNAGCIDAKRVLSEDTVADVRVVFPGVSTTVRINRAEFESRIRARLQETLAAFEGAMQSAGISEDQLDRILLVGGSSRIPLVGALLAQRFGRPLAVDTDPKNTVALGAALYGTSAAAPEVTTSPETPPMAARPQTQQAETPSPSTDVTPPIRPTSRPLPSTAVPSTAVPSTAVPSTAVPSTAVPSTELATARLRHAESAAPVVPTEASELLGVQAESGHRVRISQPVTPPPEMPDPATSSSSTESVGVDPKLVLAVVALILVVAAVVVALLLSG